MAENAGPGVRRFVFQDFSKHDMDKAQAKGHKAPTGGGARDLRLRPPERFGPIFGKMFPGRRTEKRKRSGKMVDVEIFVGEFHWEDASGHHKREATYEPPTTAVGRHEGRVPVIYTYPPLKSKPPSDEGEIILLLIQRDDGQVFPHFVTEKALKSGKWHDAVAGPILECLANRNPNAHARGYVDLETSEKWLSTHD